MDTVRIDRWLWAARSFKTRSQAQHACDAGHVRLNGQAAAPSKAVRVGDTVEDGRRVLRVKALGVVRGPAGVAASLFDDLSPPEPERPEPLALRERGAGRPTKRDRRLTQVFRGR